MKYLFGKSRIELPIRFTIGGDFYCRSSFIQTEFVYTDVPRHATDPKLTLIWPYAVHLKVDKKSVEQMPSIPVKRSWR